MRTFTKNELINKLRLKFKKINSIEKVILIGSYSNNTFDEFSDIDIVILIKDKNEAKTKDELINRKIFYKTLLSENFPIPIDVIAYTQKEWQKLKSLNSSFFKEIKETGKVIYKK